MVLILEVGIGPWHYEFGILIFRFLEHNKKYQARETIPNISMIEYYYNGKIKSHYKCLRLMKEIYDIYAHEKISSPKFT